MTGKIITVSNRLPVSAVHGADGPGAGGRGVSLRRNIGGVATGIGGANIGAGSVWVGWPGVSSSGMSAARKGEIKRLLGPGLRPVFLDDGETGGYYNGFCNSTLWPLFHYFHQSAEYDTGFFDAYRKVNEKFAKAVLEVAERGDTVWVHDYHLMLLPSLLRKQLPDAEIGFFLHIPFPSSEIFRMLPEAAEILDGLLGADLVGFHTFDYVRHFAGSVRRIKRIENSMGVFNIGSRLVKADMFPMGVDVKKFSSALKLASVKSNISKNSRLFPRNCRVILSIDRLDYTKGIDKRLEAYDLFLKENPGWRGRAVLLLVAVPSRPGVESYKNLRSKIERMVSEINGKWATMNWEPIKYLYRSFGFQAMVSLYSLADVLFITPVRDGMNLIAKEYVASRPDGRGALILSEMAGTSRELGEAFTVNPNDISGVADTLRLALETPHSERKKRMDAMRGRLIRYDLDRWTRDFLDKLRAVRRMRSEMSARALSNKITDEIAGKIKRGKKSIALFDYDGTLVPFRENPGDAKPDGEIKASLRAIAANPKIKLVIVSGRDRKTLSRWLGDASDCIIAEHGAWIRDGGKWRRTSPETAGWKKEVLSVLEIFTDRTPGSFVEEKNYSLAWHYRRVDPLLADVRVGEINEALAAMVQNLNVRATQGNKVVEVRDLSINKGASVKRWFSENNRWDCAVAMGDDSTDEDMFSVLPSSVYSIKVGHGPSRARFYTPSVAGAREFVHRLGRVK